MPGLADLRDRLLASPKFQRWAAAFPLTRGVAHRRSRELFDICAGFVYSQILFACVKLGMFDRLAAGPLTEPELSAALHLPSDATLRLLRAAMSLRLVRSRAGDRYGLGPLGAAMAGNPAIAAMVEHHAMLYADLRDPVALLQGAQPTTQLAAYWPYGEPTPDQVAPYSALMAASQTFVAADVIEAARLGRHRCLLDIGGGEGVFLSEVAARLPHLRLMLFDLPAVAERARVRFHHQALDSRASAIGGNFLSDPLPTGADVVSLVRVLHDHDDHHAGTLLAAIRRILPRGGRLLIAEPMSGTPGAEPVGDAYFGFYLLAMGRGRPRTADEIAALLRQAGFTAIRPLRTRRPMLARLIEAHSP